MICSIRLIRQHKTSGVHNVVTTLESSCLQVVITKPPMEEIPSLTLNKLYFISYVYKIIKQDFAES